MSAPTAAAAPEDVFTEGLRVEISSLQAHEREFPEMTPLAWTGGVSRRHRQNAFGWMVNAVNSLGWPSRIIFHAFALLDCFESAETPAGGIGKEKLQAVAAACLLSSVTAVADSRSVDCAAFKYPATPEGLERCSQGAVRAREVEAMLGNIHATLTSLQAPSPFRYMCAYAGSISCPTPRKQEIHRLSFGLTALHVLTPSYWQMSRANSGAAVVTLACFAASKDPRLDEAPLACFTPSTRSVRARLRDCVPHTIKRLHSADLVAEDADIALYQIQRLCHPAPDGCVHDAVRAIFQFLHDRFNMVDFSYSFLLSLR